MPQSGNDSQHKQARPIDRGNPAKEFEEIVYFAHGSPDKCRACDSTNIAQEFGFDNTPWHCSDCGQVWQHGEGVTQVAVNLKDQAPLEIKDWYEHEHPPSVFVIFRKDTSFVWSFSGNNLRSHFLAEPDEFISGPIECQIPQALYDRLSDDLDNF